MYSSAEDAMYHPVTIKDQRFWKRILIVDDDVDVTVTFKVGIQDSNNSADVNKRIEVYTSNDPLDKITAIEQGLEEEFLEVITDHQKASQILVDLAKSVKKEALFLLPNDKAMLRADRLGIIDYLIQATRHGAEVKIICPLSSKTTDIVKRIYDNTAHGIKILNGADSLYGTFIVDSEKFFRAELREPNAIEFSDAIGFTIYSNSRRSAESFKSIFELLWNERVRIN